MKKVRILVILMSCCLILSFLVSCDKVNETSATGNSSLKTSVNDVKNEPQNEVKPEPETAPETAPETDPETDPETEIGTAPEFEAATEDFNEENGEANGENADVVTTADAKETDNEETTCDEYVGDDFIEEENFEGLKFTSNGDGTCFVSKIGIYNESEIVIPSKSPSGDVVTGIGNMAFSGCKVISSVIIPEGVTWIGALAFDKCENLTHISIPSSIEVIDQDAFRGCNLECNVLFNCYYLGNENSKYVVLVDAVNKNLNSISIHADTRVILYRSFIGCNNIKELDIPNGVVSIGREAFTNCSQLKTVTLPATLKVFGMDVLDDCLALNRINYKGNIESWEYITIVGGSTNVFWKVTLVLGYGTNEEFWIETEPMEE